MRRPASQPFDRCWPWRCLHFPTVRGIGVPQITALSMPRQPGKNTDVRAAAMSPIITTADSATRRCLKAIVAGADAGYAGFPLRYGPGTPGHGYHWYANPMLHCPAVHASRSASSSSGEDPLWTHFSYRWQPEPGRPLSKTCRAFAVRVPSADMQKNRDGDRAFH